MLLRTLHKRPRERYITECPENTWGKKNRDRGVQGHKAGQKLNYGGSGRAGRGRRRELLRRRKVARWVAPLTVQNKYCIVFEPRIRSRKIETKGQEVRPVRSELKLQHPCPDKARPPRTSRDDIRPTPHLRLAPSRAAAPTPRLLTLFCSKACDDLPINSLASHPHWYYKRPVFLLLA